LREIVADGPIQYGYRCGEKVLADETDMKQIVLFQMRADELEDIEVEVVSRDHETVREIIVDATKQTAIGRCRKPCRCKTEAFTL
jgi:hypothetical protein